MCDPFQQLLLFQEKNIKDIREIQIISCINTFPEELIF